MPAIFSPLGFIIYEQTCQILGGKASTVFVFNLFWNLLSLASSADI